MIEKILERLREIGQLEISLHGGRCNGKTLTLGYKKGIENAISIVQEVAKEYEGKTVTISVDIGDLANSVEYGKKSTGKDGR